MKLVKNSSSILRKFLLFNFFAFTILGLITFFYLKGVQPNLVKQRTEKHSIIINNTSNHIERLKLAFEKESLKNFLLSTRFLFQNLERVQFYNLKGDLVADTNVLDLDQNVFARTEMVIEDKIEENQTEKNTEKLFNTDTDSQETLSVKSLIKDMKKRLYLLSSMI